MAQIIPPLTSLPIDSTAAPSAEDIQSRLPSICVDYLSHDWSEEDVWASWRSMTRHKHEIANGVRLENASWRTWQKQRGNLGTISPETLNWLKDSDVTWLYGPLHTAAVEPVRPLKISSASERLGLDDSQPKPPLSVTTPTVPTPTSYKPILKHRTLSEMLTIPTPSSPILEASGRDEDGNGDDELERPVLLQTKSDTNIFRNRTNSRKRSPPRGPITSGSNSGKATPPDKPESPSVPSTKRHISFNTFVEQCVAVDDPADIPMPMVSETDDEDDSEDDMLEMRSSSFSSSGSRPRPSSSRTSSTTSADHLTIAKIAPTMLKTTAGILPPNRPQMVYAPPPEYLSPSLSSASGSQSGRVNPGSMPVFDFPSPQVSTHGGKWSGASDDEEEFGSVGYDYFGEPDLGTSPQSASNPSFRAQGSTNTSGASSNTATGTSTPTPVVGHPPTQAKWRTPTSSSENSSNNSTTNVGTGTSPQPAAPSRGILKVRAPGPAPPTPEPASPPSSYFNYTPSAATGIGGMRGSISNPPPGSGVPWVPTEIPGPSGSPVAVTAEDIPVRGRSASRDRGPGWDRSSSRGSTGAGSVGSISPGGGGIGGRGSPNEGRGAGVAGGSGAKLGRVVEGVVVGNEGEGEYVMEKSETPTPHSSPQISFRPLKDTSPASLPHHSTASTPTTSSTLPLQTPNSSTSRVISPPSGSDLPLIDPPQLANNKATTAQVPTTSQLGLISQPPALGTPDEEGESDGSSIMGRAVNIASSAKDLLGALWYGGGEEGVRTAGVGQGVGGRILGGRVSSGGASGGEGAKKGHRRNQSHG